ncbi:MAG TPA: hypothetical protein VJ756_05375 [Terriglobales bacterium]|nr:hypothetical protein [Terriglobales bacterium]
MACAQGVDPDLYAGLRWRCIGPFRGGRALAAAGVPGEPETFYFGAVGGGVWKTTDSGRVWKPIFDAAPIASIGALAVAPSNPSVLYVGTGEADMRSDISFGDGVYKSTDAGKTWRNVGLRETRHIGRIMVDPHNPDVVLVAALGRAYGPNLERGVFRTTDGGRTWQKVLFKDENTGAVDLALDPDNPQTVFATLWRTRRPPWSTYAPLGGPGSGLYKSTDEGSTWTEISSHGLPSGELGRIGVAVSAGTHGQRVYAIVDAKQKGGLYRSDDGGANWTLVSADRRIHQRGWYFGTVTADPLDPNRVYIPNVSLYRSTDGGKTFTSIKGAPGGDDYHLLWVDPGESRRMIVASDQGTTISVDDGQTWSSWYNQPTAQFYHVATDNQFPYKVYGAQQDSGTAGTLSRSDYGQITFRDWRPVGGDEGGYIVPDPSDPNFVYAGGTLGELHRFNWNTGESHDISPWPSVSFGTEISGRKYRFTWTSPIVFSPQDSHTLYMGAQVLLETRDRGMSWQAISPDLTGAEAGAANAQGQLAVNNAMQRGYGVIYTVAPSPINPGMIWVGTDTGLIQLTRDGGKSWENVTPKTLAPWSKISLIDASRFDAGTAYAAVDRHRVDDFRPYIYRTHDYGKTWTQISEGIPNAAYVHVVREDSERKGLLFAGTETGVYVSFDDGGHWQPLQLNLPVAPIHDLVVHGGDLVVATHGRSFWILDDITSLRQLSLDVARADAHLFRPSVALRVRGNQNRDTPLPPETPAGQNPPEGAIFDYYLKTAASAPLVLEIADVQGNVVRRFSSSDVPPSVDFSQLAFPPYWVEVPDILSNEAGEHRFVWDLRYPTPQWLFHEYSMAAVVGETPVAPRGPLVLPGKYEVRLTARGQTYRQPLQIKEDPRVSTSPADLARQLQLELQITDAVSKDMGAYHQISASRKQLEQMLKEISRKPGMAKLAAAATELDSRLTTLAGGSPIPGGTATFATVNGTLAAVLNAVESADTAPTAQSYALFEETQRSLQALLASWQKLQQRDMAELNRQAKRSGLQEVDVPPMK